MRRKVLPIAVLSTVFLLLVALVFYFRGEAKNSERIIAYYGEMAENDLVSSLESIDTTLSKCKTTVNEKSLRSLCADIFKSALSAVDSLSILRNNDCKYDKIYDFLSLCGDYSYSVLSGYSDDKLYTSLCSLSQVSKNVLSSVTDGEFEGEIDIPSLIYDGKRSGDYDSDIYKTLSDADEISEKDCLKAVSEVLFLDDLALTGEIEGELPCYVFENENERVQVSKKGGKIISYRRFADVSEAKIENSEAIYNAEELLSRLSIDNVVKTDCYRQDNVLLCKFVSVCGEYMCYPDEITVGVSLSDGSIMSLDAESYYKYGRERTVPENLPEMTESNEYIHSSLSLNGTKKAVIHSKGNREIFCCEYSCCDDEGNKYRIYSDASSGELCDFKICCEDENGTKLK